VIDANRTPGAVVEGPVHTCVHDLRVVFCRRRIGRLMSRFDCEGPSFVPTSPLQRRLQHRSPPDAELKYPYP